MKHIAAALTNLLLAGFVAEAKPVKVFILAGQSIMVGIGQVVDGDLRWGKEPIRCSRSMTGLLMRKPTAIFPNAR